MGFNCSGKYSLLISLCRDNSRYSVFLPLPPPSALRTHTHVCTHTPPHTHTFPLSCEQAKNSQLVSSCNLFLNKEVGPCNKADRTERTFNTLVIVDLDGDQGGKVQSWEMKSGRKTKGKNWFNKKRSTSHNGRATCADQEPVNTRHSPSTREERYSSQRLDL